jgi:hypothetical protein
VWGNFLQGAGTPGTQRDIAFSQLAVKGLKERKVSGRLTRGNVRVVIKTTGRIESDGGEWKKNLSW